MHLVQRHSSVTPSIESVPVYYPNQSFELSSRWTILLRPLSKSIFDFEYSNPRGGEKNVLVDIETREF